MSFLNKDSDIFNDDNKSSNYRKISVDAPDQNSNNNKVDNPSHNAASLNRRLRLRQMERRQKEKRKERLDNTGMIRIDALQPQNSPSGTAGSNTPVSAGPVFANFITSSAPHTPNSPHTPKQYAFNTNKKNNDNNNVQDLISERQKERNNASNNLSPLEKEMQKKGVERTFDPRADTQVNQNVTNIDKRSLLLNPIQKNTVFQCYIVRNNKGMIRKLHPIYELYSQDGTFLLAAKKRPGNKTSNYLISTSRDDLSRESESYIGKVRSNFVGTEFQLFDNGVNPGRVNEHMSPAVARDIRCELGFVLYESNILGSKGPRKMKVILPEIVRDTPRVFRQTMNDNKSPLLEHYENSDDRNTNGVWILENKQPRWHDDLQAYVLNFSGRVTMASVKNFQLCFQANQDNVILQFGRNENNNFAMDVAWPLSVLQAFQICLTSFDYKLALE